VAGEERYLPVSSRLLRGVRMLLLHSRCRSAESDENRSVENELAALRGAGHDPELLERGSEDVATWSLREQAVLTASSAWNLQVRRTLLRTLRSSPFGIVHVHDAWLKLSASALSALCLEGLPVVVSLHSYQLGCATGSFQRHGRDYRLSAGRRLVLPLFRHGGLTSRRWTVVAGLATASGLPACRTQPSGYLFLSEAQRHSMQGVGFPEDCCFVKWNLVPDLLAADPEIGCGEGGDDAGVVFVGRFAPAKGLRVLMDAWERVQSELVPLGSRLSPMGDGGMSAEIHQWAQGWDGVEVLGALPRAESLRRMASARAVVIPSLWAEPFGRVAVEATAPGTGVIPTRRAEFVTSDVDGALVAPGDVDSLARELRTLVSDPGRWRRLGARGAPDLPREARSTSQRRTPDGDLPIRHRPPFLRRGLPCRPQCRPNQTGPSRRCPVIGPAMHRSNSRSPRRIEARFSRSTGRNRQRRQGLKCQSMP